MLPQLQTHQMDVHLFDSSPANSVTSGIMHVNNSINGNKITIQTTPEIAAFRIQG